MVQLEGDELHFCYNCDAEFEVLSSTHYDEDIIFCPYCGTDIGTEEDEDDEDSSYFGEDED